MASKGGPRLVCLSKGVRSMGLKQEVTEAKRALGVCQQAPRGICHLSLYSVC